MYPADEAALDLRRRATACGSRALACCGSTTAYLFGRKTYEHMAAHWPNEPDSDPIARHLNATPKYVATRTLTQLESAGSQISGGDVVRSVSDLKHEGDGVITVLGSGQLTQTPDRALA